MFRHELVGELKIEALRRPVDRHPLRDLRVPRMLLVEKCRDDVAESPDAAAIFGWARACAC